jgi:c(7)-type cytochrome triheme protein
MNKRLIIIFNLLSIFFVQLGAIAADQAFPGILYTTPLESVIFSHQDHTQKGLSCNTCHSGLFKMEVFQVQKNKDFTMDSLYKGKYCGACHNGKKAFASNTQCARCHVGSDAKAIHEDIPDYKMAVTLGRGDNVVNFNHDIHIKKEACWICHSSLFKPEEGADKITMADHSQKKFCFTCHDQQGKEAFSWSDCNRCHQKSFSAPKETIKFGEGDKAVVFKHETHQLQSSCQFCHPNIFSFRKGTAKIDFGDHVNGKSCFTCHNQKGSAFFNCNRCHVDKPDLKAGVFYPKTLKYETKMQNVYFHHISHAEFSCDQCHPAPFVMKKGQIKMNMTEMLHGGTCGVCHNGNKAFNARECAKCHKK